MYTLFRDLNRRHFGVGPEQNKVLIAKIEPLIVSHNLAYGALQSRGRGPLMMTSAARSRG